MEFDMLALINQYVKPELMIAVPLLLFLGKQLKDSNRISNTLINNILSYVGIAVAMIYNLSIERPADMYGWLMLVLVSVLSGMVLSYTAVGLFEQKKSHDKHKIEKMFTENEEGESVAEENI